MSKKTGVGMFVRSEMFGEKVYLITNLEIIAVEILQSESITCNIYTSPPEHFTIEGIQGIVNQLPRLHVLLGDFNANDLPWEPYVTNQITN